MATCNHDTWTGWATTSSSTTYTSTDCWTAWNYDIPYTTTTSTSTASDDYIWLKWVGEPVKSEDIKITYRSNNHAFRPIKYSLPTVEQKRASSAQYEINKIWTAIRIEEEKERKIEAELTAKKLLEDLIDEEQMKLYNETGRLIVRGKKFDYVIRKEGGVYQVDKDKVYDLCIHLKEKYKYPLTDNVIALTILIKGDEKKFLKTANNHGEVQHKEDILSLINRKAA